MKLSCERCGCKFSKKEIDEFLEFPPMRFICEECFLMEEDHTIPEETFDSDSGL